MRALVRSVYAKLGARSPKRKGTPLNSQKKPTVVQLIYREIEMTLWAFGAALAIYFLIFTLPKLPESRIRAEFLRVAEINAENDRFCQTLHIKPKTPMHADCILALGQLRKDIENRFAFEHEF